MSNYIVDMLKIMGAQYKHTGEHEAGEAGVSINLRDGIITVRHTTAGDDIILWRGKADRGTWTALWAVIRMMVKHDGTTNITKEDLQ